MKSSYPYRFALGQVGQLGQTFKTLANRAFHVSDLHVYAGTALGHGGRIRTGKSRASDLPKRISNAAGNEQNREAKSMYKVSEAPAPAYPPDGPIGDLLAVEALLDLLRLAIEKDFAGDVVECRQESAAVAAAHALRLVHRARLGYAEALAVAVSSQAVAVVPKAKRPGRTPLAKLQIA